jgi:chemotaxis protein methyltransferase CheR
MSTTTLTTQVPLTEPELKLLQTLVYQECGMYFDERRTHFLRDRLQRRLKACQLDSFYNYYRLLTSREGKKELTALVENLTVNETSFFRIRPQLDLFQKVVLEDILKRKQERLLDRPGALHPGDDGLRRAGLLLFAQSASL